MLIISPSLPLSLCMLIFYLRYKLEDDRRAAETSFGTFTVNIYCKLFKKKCLLIFSDHLFYQYRGTLLIARKELKHLPTWGIGIVDGWPLTWRPSWEKRAETLHQGNVMKSRQRPEIRYTPRLFLETFKCNDYKLISRFFFLVLSRSYFIFPRYFHGFTDFQLYYTDFDITGCSCNLLDSQQRNLFIINTLWKKLLSSD